MQSEPYKLLTYSAIGMYILYKRKEKKRRREGMGERQIDEEERRERDNR